MQHVTQYYNLQLYNKKFKSKAVRVRAPAFVCPIPYPLFDASSTTMAAFLFQPVIAIRAAK